MYGIVTAWAGTMCGLRQAKWPCGTRSNTLSNRELPSILVKLQTASFISQFLCDSLQDLILPLSHHGREWACAQVRSVLLLCECNFPSTFEDHETNKLSILGRHCCCSEFMPIMFWFNNLLTLSWRWSLGVRVIPCGDEARLLGSKVSGQTAYILTAAGAAYGTAKSGIGIAGVGTFRSDLIMKVSAHLGSLNLWCTG